MYRFVVSSTTMTQLIQHQFEIQNNQRAWEEKTLLRQIYSQFYDSIRKLVDPSIRGTIVELGSGIGNLREHVENVVCTDLFQNPWLDVVCDGYRLPFRDRSVSHLVLFDVFHHLQAPKAFLREARRVLAGGGRLILFEPYISLASFPVYGLLHHEPVAWNRPINFDDDAPRREDYYAAQGNATRLFFRGEVSGIADDWNVFFKKAYCAFAYLFSGGYSKPAFYPGSFLPLMNWIDTRLSGLPKVFASRCLIGLTPVNHRLE
jgi:SAM-dependent methyltransferase